jgi:hypothetical protein
MIKHIFNIIITISFLSFNLSLTCYATNNDSILAPDTKKFVLGDINNDRIIDTAFIFTPSRINDIPEGNDTLPCQGKCYNIVTFSCGFPPIKIDNSILGQIESIDDLNGDGNKELIFQTNWFIGSHVEIYVYTLINNNWKIIAKDWLYGRDSYKDRVRKINNNEFVFLKEIWVAKEQTTKDKKQLIKFK